MSNQYQPTTRLLSIRDAGWIEVGDTRVFLCDALGGFYALREQLVHEVGYEFEADILYRAGFASTDRLMQYAVANGFLDSSQEGLERALHLLTMGGYGQFSLDEGRYQDGWARVTVQNSVEAWMIREHGSRSGFVCDYVRGLLRGVMHHLLATSGQSAAVIECAEISCQANGDPECRFVVGTQTELSAHGYRVGDRGHISVRETLLRLNRQLEEVLEAAQKDSLTGLYNRSYFDSVLRHRIEFANRSTDMLALAIIDLDRFKQVNDTRGHGVGDVALRQIARLLSSQARETDVVARYGGDEFAWLMPDTAPEAALAVADRIRRLVQETQEVSGIPLTISIGIATCPGDAATLSELIDLADDAMYRAKDSGGNQVRCHRRPVDGLPAPRVPAARPTSSKRPPRRHSSVPARASVAPFKRRHSAADGKSETAADGAASADVLPEAGVLLDNEGAEAADIA